MISYCHHRHSAPDAKAAALDVRDLSVAYPGDAKDAISGLSLHVHAGVSLALVGPNGAGKSTLFKAISGLLPVREGQVRVFGRHLGECHHRVVYLPQRSAIDWQFPSTVLDLVLTGRYVYLGWLSKPKADDVSMAMDALAQLGIEDLGTRQINKLSGGQQQRALIARALVQKADLFLLDEPLNAVDAVTRQTVANVLAKLKQEGKTVLVATHYYDKEEGIYDGAVYLKDGQQVATVPVPGHEGCQHP